MCTERVPDFFLVGHPKTGTSALYKMLRTHPGIFMPIVKEPMFLAAELRKPWTRETYLDLFAPARDDQLVGEASSLYMLSPVAIEAIAELNPEARAIAIFREPAEWLRSLHAQMLKNHVESVLDLRSALALEPLRKDGHKLPQAAVANHRTHMLQYTSHVRYADQLARLHRVLGPERVLLVLHDDLRSDYAGVLRAVYRFLGVDDSVEMPRIVANVTERRMRFQGLDRHLNAVMHGRGGYRFVKTPIKSVLPRSTRLRAVQEIRRRVVFGPLPQVDWNLDHELRVSFKSEVERFGQMIDRDLVTQWGYSDI